MSEARSRILDSIRSALGRNAHDASARQRVETHLSGHPRNLIPARGQPAPELRTELFCAMATGVSATVERLTSLPRLPHAVADYLHNHGLAQEIRMAPDGWLLSFPWDRRPALSLSHGPARDQDAVSVTLALAGVAETGTLVLASGPDHPTGLNFLPETQIAVLPLPWIVGCYEEVWDLFRVRQARGEGWPRTINLVTGPSRTGDIEQNIQLGAHGPRRLHIILVDAVPGNGPGGSR